MSTTTILATTAAVNASSAASSGGGSAAPAIWMLVMFVLIIPWAAYLHSDECMGPDGGEKARNATVTLAAIGVILIPVICWIAG